MNDVGYSVIRQHAQLVECVSNERHIQHHTLDILSARVHPAEALLTKRLDPGLQTSRDVAGDVDSDAKHQPEVNHARLMVTLQLLLQRLEGINTHFFLLASWPKPDLLI